MESSATYRILGEYDAHTARHITEVLRMTPSTAHEAGDPIPRRPGHTYDRAAWHLETTPDCGPELADSIQELLVQLEPVSQQLWALEAEGYWCNWRCTIGARHTDHAAELDRDTQTRLLALPGELWLDVYSTDDLFIPVTDRTLDQHDT